MRLLFNPALLIVLSILSSCAAREEKEDSGSNRLAGKGFGISSATFIVQNIDSTRNYFRDALGFDMPDSGKSEPGMYDGTISASVYFPDFSSLEFLSVKDTSRVKSYPFINSFLKKHRGVRSYSLSISSADSTFTWFKAQGLMPDSIHSGRSTNEKPKGWNYDDGGAQWRDVSFNRQDPPAYLPGFVEWTGFPYQEIYDEWKPYAWRKYYDSNANGVIGIAALRIVVADIKAARAEFQRMGLKLLQSTDSMVRFQVAHNQELQLFKPTSTSDAGKFFQDRGAGVYAICFDVIDLDATQQFLAKKLPGHAFRRDTVLNELTVSREFAYGVQLEFKEESKEQGRLARIYSFKEGTKLDTASVKHASALYTKYCALCHGKDREGYAADFAPSLRSHSLMATTQLPRSAYNYLSHTIAYGRPGTAMAPYAKNQGGPLDQDDIELLLQWLHESSGVKKPIEMSAKPVAGNAGRGKTLYAQHCASCHGAKGEGVNAPALGNPMLLATASDAFLRHTISEGRDNTPMPSFKDSFSKTEINAITAYLRSRASGWNAPDAITIKKKGAKNYILNRTHKAPVFKLREGRYVSADQLLQALKDSARIIMLDARSAAAWHQSHIPGAVSVPYYEEPDTFVKDIPNDNTWIVVYCACPHAASLQVVNTLRRFGYKNTAILDEGILVWAQRGYPFENGNAAGLHN